MLPLIVDIRIENSCEYQCAAKNAAYRNFPIWTLHSISFRAVIDKLVNTRSAHQGRNVFWKKEKKVQVELTAPITIIHPDCEIQKTGTKAQQRECNLDKEFSLKLIISFALTVQAFFFIAGYLGFTVRYEQYGIRTGELDLANSTILAEGYRQTLSILTSGDGSFSITRTFFMLLPFLLASLAATYLLTNGKSKWIDFIAKTSLGWVLLFILFFLPALGLLHNIEEAKKDIKEETGLNAKSDLNREQTISTKDGGMLSGKVIAADTKVTFFLSEHTVYKVDNATGRVLRKILFKEAPITASTGD